MSVNGAVRTAWDRMLRWLGIGFCILLMPWDGSARAAPVTGDAESLLEQCAQVRESVASGHINCTIRWWKEGIQTNQRTCDIVFEGVRLHYEASGSDPVDSVEEIIVFDGNRYYDLPSASGSRRAVTLRYNRREGDRPIYLPPRTIGMSTSDGQAHTVRELLGNSQIDCTKAVVTTEQGSGGYRLFKIAHCTHRRAGVALTYWLSPDQQMSLVRFQLDVRDRQITLENTLKLYEGVVWFPERVVVTDKTGKVVQREVEYTVNSATFNHEVDERLFTLEGLELSRGAVVGPILDDKGNQRGAVWDGTQLVDEQVWRTQKREEALQARTLGHDMHWSVFAIVVMLASVGAALSYWFWRRRGQSDASPLGL